MNTFNSNNEVLSFFVYMWNKFSRGEAMLIWGGELDNPYCLANHIWNKYVSYVNEYGSHAAVSMFVSDLDSNNLELLVNRACSLYNGRSNR